MSNNKTITTVDTKWYIDFSILVIKYGIPSIIKFVIFAIIAASLFCVKDIELRVASLMTFIVPITLDNAIMTFKSIKEIYSIFILFELLMLLFLVGGSGYVFYCFVNNAAINEFWISFFTILATSNPIIELMYEILYNKRQERKNDYGSSD